MESRKEPPKQRGDALAPVSGNDAGIAQGSTGTSGCRNHGGGSPKRDPKRRSGIAFGGFLSGNRLIVVEIVPRRVADARSKQDGPTAKTSEKYWRQDRIADSLSEFEDNYCLSPTGRVGQQSA